MDENKRKHLEFIQNVITRMAGNLFFLKGWAITLIAALFALSAKDANPNYVVIAFFPVLIFWVLDIYFLRQERLFRSLYKDVARRNEKDIDFSMDTSKYEREENNTYEQVFLSPTLLVFYFGLILVMFFVIVLIQHYGH